MARLPPSLLSALLLLAGVLCIPFILLDAFVRWARGKFGPGWSGVRALAVVPRESRAPAALSHPSLGVASFVTLPNGRIVHYFSKGSGPLMLCIHGFPESPYSWRYVSQAFATTHTVVCVSLPGYGAAPHAEPSWWNSSDYGPAAVITTMRMLVEHLQAEVRRSEPPLSESPRGIVLVGHDWGGLICWLLAAEHPELVARLVIMDLPHPRAMAANMSARQLSRSWYISFFQLPLLPEWYLLTGGRALVQAVFKGKGGGVHSSKWRWISDEDVDVFAYTTGRAGTPTAALSYYRQMPYYLEALRAAMLHRLGKRGYPMPVLQLHGSADAFLGTEQCAGTEALCCGGYQLHVVEGASHWVQQDCPEEVVRVMGTWLGVVPTAPLPLAELPPAV